MKSDKRFVKIYTQNSFASGFEIWVDRETGVNYLYRQTGYAGGMTVMLNSDGSPIITPAEELKFL